MTSSTRPTRILSSNEPKFLRAFSLAIICLMLASSNLWGQENKQYNVPIDNGSRVSSPTVVHHPKPDKWVTYKTIDGVELKLHCFQPEDHQANDQAAAIVFFFGGGWTGGDPKQFYGQARRLADCGMVAMTAEYRVHSRNQTSPFECVKDGKSAIRWVRKNAKDLGIDSNRIIAAGGSAGGHVAACTATISAMDEEGEDLSVSAVPNALILFNPVLDTTAKGFGLSKVGEDRQTEISPCHHVSSGVVPTLIFHGSADRTVPFENPKRFTKLMTEAGNICQLEEFEGEGHGFFNRGRSKYKPQPNEPSVYQKIQQETETFLKLHNFLD